MDKKSSLHSKNFNRNIFVLFRNWLLQNSSFSESSDLNLLMIRKPRFNNRLVTKISKNPALRKIFLQFCEKEGHKSIKKSRISDK